MKCRLVLDAIALALALVTVASDKVYYRTRWGLCSNCIYDNSEKYSWCSLGIGSFDWDYCSVSAGFSTRLDRCKNECDFHGESYMWCYLEKGSWDYCTRIEHHSATYFTRYGKECQNTCWPNARGNVDICRTSDNDEDECSFLPGETVSGAVCNAENDGTTNSCGYHGYSYTWCYASGVEGYNWDYCSISSGFSRSRKKRAVAARQVGAFLPCPGEDGATCKVVSYIDIPLRVGTDHLVTYIARENRTYGCLTKVDRNEGGRPSKDFMGAVKLMQRWRALKNAGNILAGNQNTHRVFPGDRASNVEYYFDKQTFFDEVRSPKVVKNGNNIVDRGTRRFVNLQLQKPQSDGSLRSYSLSQVHVQVGDGWGTQVTGLRYIAAEQFIQYIVTAQEASIRNQAKVWVWQRLEDKFGNVIGKPLNGRWDGRE